MNTSRPSLAGVCVHAYTYSVNLTGENSPDHSRPSAKAGGSHKDGRRVKGTLTCEATSETHPET